MGGGWEEGIRRLEGIEKGGQGRGMGRSAGPSNFFLYFPATSFLYVLLSLKHFFG